MLKNKAMIASIILYLHNTRHLISTGQSNASYGLLHTNLFVPGELMVTIQYKLKQWHSIRNNVKIAFLPSIPIKFSSPMEFKITDATALLQRT